MLQSKIMLERANEENHRHYQAVSEINSEIAKIHSKLSELTIKLETENSIHKNTLCLYERNYHVSVAMENKLVEDLKEKFDRVFPFHPILDYYTEFEILQNFSPEDFLFMRETKMLVICGYGEVPIFTTNWRRKEN